ncbi:MAG: UDP-2,3-diacylglucosamine diphosphatase LpxI [Spirochaetota bacterium]|nr:UDP-2,3-diacylglucosamine diphosphatase LpxI [Spirochaetota bacterium]
MNKDRIAILAGDGELPVILAGRLSEQSKIKVIIVLQGLKKRFENFNCMVLGIAHGQVTEILRLLSENRINKVIIIGKIDKRGFIQRKGFDENTLKIIQNMMDGKDLTIFQSIHDVLEKIGIEILPQDLYLNDMIVDKGILTELYPTERENEDAIFGMEYAKQLATMDIGQTIVVNNKTILAVEAAEGTNDAIKRGGLIGKHGSVVCKAARNNQDRRFDIPAVGIQTVRIMSKYGCSLLALEAGMILLVNRDEVIDYANKKKLILMGM